MITEKEGTLPPGMRIECFVFSLSRVSFDDPWLRTAHRRVTDLHTTSLKKRIADKVVLSAITLPPVLEI
jgi:hypothetical protein